MNLELFIAHRLLGGRETGSAAVPIVRIAVVGIALGVCAMLLSVFILTGFKQEITAKLSGFTAHLDITTDEQEGVSEGEGMPVSDSLLAGMRAFREVKQVYPYVAKPAILKSGTEIHGVILRGVDSTYRMDFYRDYLKSGELPDYAVSRPSADILLSSAAADLLQVKVGDRLSAHFVQEPPRVRMFSVKGLYDTGFKEYDEMVVLCDSRHLQRLNGWKSGRFSGIGVELTDLDKLRQMKDRIADFLPWGGHGGFYRIATLRESAPQIFDWLDLLNMNVAIILILIVAVAGFNMVSGLLVLILDKTALIGILKALGYQNVSLRKLFLYVAVGLTFRGMLAGNLLALLLGGVQYFFRVISLDPGSYYMDKVPVDFNAAHILLLNAGVIAVSVLMLIIPTMLISRIRPIKAIRFE